MKKQLLIIIAITAAAFISGCTTVPQQAQRTSAVISASKEEVWPLLVSEVAMNYPVQAIDKESGLLTTQFVNMPVGFNNSGMERFIFKPAGFMATWAGLRMNLRIMAIETEPEKTMLTINAHYEAFENNMQKSWIVARSNGSVENRILTNIQRKLQ